MAADRIGRETAHMVPLPPHSWQYKKVGWLLEQEKIKENIRNVPENKPLEESLREHGMLNPILCMPNWWPIAGSQRLRVLSDLVKQFPTINDWEINVCTFDEEYWLIWYLWGDLDFRDKAVAITFQMYELVWKSRYYRFDKDPDGTEMTYFEALGDELEWKHSGRMAKMREESRKQQLDEDDLPIG